MDVSLREYARGIGKSPDTVRRLAEQGRLSTARKIGRNWVIDSEEPYPGGRRIWKIASMFSGCGGMDLGFLGGFTFLGKRYVRNPYSIVWANEINPAACRTYRANIGDIIEGDVNDVLDTIPEGIDVIIGGFPCQDISINGKMRGIAGERSGLYTAIVRAVRERRPRAFVVENVGSLLMKTNEGSFRKIMEDFGALGYNLDFNLYDASRYGVPQTRERVFIVGTRSDMPAFAHPEPLASAPITAREAIGDLEQLERDPAFAHIWSLAKRSGEQGNRTLVADRPGYTIRAECHGNIQFHYGLPRRISMREAARIQSFPDTFEFPCGLRETERQIGNAVPPVLAWRLARALTASLEGASHGPAAV